MWWYFGCEWNHHWIKKQDQTVDAAMIMKEFIYQTSVLFLRDEQSNIFLKNFYIFKIWYDFQDDTRCCIL
jgi:hypothetical protein